MSASPYHGRLNEALSIPHGAEAVALDGSGPFARLDWFALLAAHGAPGARIVMAGEPGQEAALALVEAGPRKLAALVNWYSFRFGPLGRGAGNAASLAALAAAVDADELVLAPVSGEDARRLVDALRAGGWRVLVEPCDINHHLLLDGRDFATYWAGRPGALRETVRRKSRKGLVDLELSDQFDPATWDAYEAIYAASWKPGEGNPALLRAFAEAEGRAGRLRMGLASIGGKPAAAQFWTVEDGVAYIHKLAHDESAKALSPGTLLSHAMFEAAIDRDKVREIDFGTGDNPYKRDWVDRVRPRYRIEAFRAGAVRSWPRLARRLAARLRDRRPLVSLADAG